MDRSREKNLASRVDSEDPTIRPGEYIRLSYQPNFVQGILSSLNTRLYLRFGSNPTICCLVVSSKLQIRLNCVRVEVIAGARKSNLAKTAASTPWDPFRVSKLLSTTMRREASYSSWWV